MTNSEKLIEREFNLASWRIIAFLTFNGFIFNGISAATDRSTKPIQFLLTYAPWLGLALSISFLVVAVLSSETERKLKSKNKWDFYVLNFFGPYILSSFLLMVFWFFFLFQGSEYIAEPVKVEIVANQDAKINIDDDKLSKLILELLEVKSQLITIPQYEKNLSAINNLINKIDSINFDKICPSNPKQPVHKPPKSVLNPDCN